MFALSAQHPIAFFCAEFGIDSSLPIYAGGLGVLAGDILKEAADQKLPYVGIGLLYRGQNAVQNISPEGHQYETNNDFDPISAGLEHVYQDEMPLFIKVHLTEIDVWVRCWQKKIGETVTLYLLDPDTEQNQVEQRSIAHALYAGTEEEVIKQQLILGIGGVKLLHALGIHPSLYHVNEGRPAYLHWQLIRSYQAANGLSYNDARVMATNKTVYTNHTLVEAGNQEYATNLLRAYGAYYANKMNITTDELLSPGMNAATGEFSITKYALSTSRKASAVSQLHYQFCQAQWPKHNWVGITNGVHFPTWQSERIKNNASHRTNLWKAHQEEKYRTMEFIQHRTGFGYDPSRLVLTWARRITGYKQLLALFEDVNRLRDILNNSARPIQLLIAGKAHMYDELAKQDLQKVIQYMQHELSGHALFVPNLDIALDQALVRGSDVWLNTPRFGLEASGTSGMKALSNGVLQCTVKDGWAHEVEWSELGWVLENENISQNFYELLETQIAPMFYSRDEAGIPVAWLERMQKSIQLSPQFSATRMMKQYQEELYT